MKLTVAFDARLLGQHKTGDTSYWRGLVRGLMSIEPNVRFLLMSNAPKPSGIPDSDDFRWITAGSQNNRWWSLVQFPLMARKLGAKVVHTQYNLSPLAGRHGVTTIHDVSFFIGPQWFSPRDRFLLQTQIPASVRRAARVLTVSETSKKDIEHWVPASVGKVRVTPNALGDNISVMPDAEAASVVAAMGVVEPYLLTVGTRWPRKNFALAVEAAKMAGKQLVVIGQEGWGGDPSGPCYTGYVDDRQLTACYQRASLYLAPSFHEGFGIPLLEAFACRCPVMCSSGGALPEVSGGAAEVMESFEPQQWSDRIFSLLSDSSKLEAMRQRGLTRVGDFSWEETARLTCDAYREAAL